MQNRVPLSSRLAAHCLQRFKAEVGDKIHNYENVKIPGPKNPYRKAAD